jgi:hypothetical protein
MAVYSFDSLDDMFEHMGQDMREADARVEPWQTRLKPGGYFMRESQHGFTIYGKILDEDEPRAKGLELYRFCRAYSVACPRGELGDIHVSTIEQLISRGQFEATRRSGWFP